MPRCAKKSTGNAGGANRGTVRRHGRPALRRAHLPARSTPRNGPVGVLTRFGHQVPAAVRDADALATAAREHRPDTAVARELYVTEAAVDKHVGNILQKLGLHLDGHTPRRVLAVLTCLRA